MIFTLKKIPLRHDDNERMTLFTKITLKALLYKNVTSFISSFKDRLFEKVVEVG